MIISASDFVQRNGTFKIESYQDATGRKTQVSSDMCGLPILAMKNEYEVRFVRDG